MESISNEGEDTDEDDEAITEIKQVMQNIKTQEKTETVIFFMFGRAGNLWFLREIKQDFNY